MDSSFEIFLREQNTIEKQSKKNKYTKKIQKKSPQFWTFNLDIFSRHKNKPKNKWKIKSEKNKSREKNKYEKNKYRASGNFYFFGIDKGEDE